MNVSSSTSCRESRHNRTPPSRWNYLPCSRLFSFAHVCLRATLEWSFRALRASYIETHGIKEPLFQSNLLLFCFYFISWVAPSVRILNDSSKEGTQGKEMLRLSQHKITLLTTNTSACTTLWSLSQEQNSSVAVGTSSKWDSKAFHPRLQMQHSRKLSKLRHRESRDNWCKGNTSHFELLQTQYQILKKVEVNGKHIGP
jgi:hypothetical protein